jgi:hypothetical protein
LRAPLRRFPAGFAAALPRFAASSACAFTVAAMRTPRLTIPLLALALAPAACGGADEQAATTTARTAPAAKPANIPPELVGTWTTTLHRSEVPRQFALNNPFSVRITRDGGIDNAPAFTLADATETIEGEVSTPEFSGDTVTLRHEGCLVDGVGYRFYDNVYRWTVRGDTLRFTVVKNACKDRFAESILTSRTFRRDA